MWNNVPRKREEPFYLRFSTASEREGVGLRARACGPHATAVSRFQPFPGLKSAPRDRARARGRGQAGKGREGMKEVIGN